MSRIGPQLRVKVKLDRAVLRAQAASGRMAAVSGRFLVSSSFARTALLDAKFVGHVSFACYWAGVFAAKRKLEKRSETR